MKALKQCDEKPALPELVGDTGISRESPRNPIATSVAMFIYGLSGGGAQRRCLTLAAGFAARGLTVDLVVVNPEGPLALEFPDSVRLVTLDAAASRLLTKMQRRVNVRGLQTLMSTVSLALYLRRVRPRVLLSGASHVNLVSVWARRFAGVPVPLVLRASNHPSGNPALWPRGGDMIRRSLRWMAGRVYPWADGVIAVSQGVADEVARLTGLPAAAVTTIYNPVVTPELMCKAEEPVGHSWFEPGQPPVLLGAGTLKIQKDFSTLIRAFARVRMQRQARLIILGEGSQRQRLQALIHSLGLGGDVDMPGFVANPYAWMARARLFVLSSAWEGLPGALIEALACGCSVVSTDCPSGPAEILQSGAYGPLVPVGDDRAMAAAIQSELELPADPRRQRTRAAYFSVDAAVDRYLEVLERAAGRTLN